MINKILIAVDRSQNNEFVFDTAVSLAQATGADLMLLHILLDCSRQSRIKRYQRNVFRQR